ncbi:MAG: MAPEG family protein [Pseudomonadota bacterium]
MHIPVTGFAAAVCGLLLLFLAMRVSMLRMQHQVALGDGGIAALMRAIRVHANTVEQVPIFLVQCACYEIYLGAGPLLIALVAAFLLARGLFAWGLSRRTLSAPRRVGAGLTYIVQLILSLCLLEQVVVTLF